MAVTSTRTIRGKTTGAPPVKGKAVATKKAPPPPTDEVPVTPPGPNPIQVFVDNDAQWNEGIIVPRTARGVRTQKALMEAARGVFVRDGFVDAKITDITAEAGVASGTFYTYFDSKEAIFTAVVKDVNQHLYIAATGTRDTANDPVARIEATTRSYVRAYREQAGLLAILEQVATISPRFREMRRGIREIFRTRSAKGIRRLQEAGRVDPTLSPEIVAEVLTSMTSNFCYVWLVLGEDYDEDEAVRTITTIWARGIGLMSPQIPTPG